MKITFQHYDTTISWENKYDDLDSTEVMNAFKGILVAATYLESGIIESMRSIVEDYDDIHNKNEKYNENMCNQ